MCAEEEENERCLGDYDHNMSVFGISEILSATESMLQNYMSSQ